MFRSRERVPERLDEFPPPFEEGKEARERPGELNLLVVAVIAVKAAERAQDDVDLEIHRGRIREPAPSGRGQKRDRVLYRVCRLRAVVDHALEEVGWCAELAAGVAKCVPQFGLRRFVDAAGEPDATPQARRSQARSRRPQRGRSHVASNLR